jgi:hypothetical protein
VRPPGPGSLGAERGPRPRGHRGVAGPLRRARASSRNGGPRSRSRRCDSAGSGSARGPRTSCGTPGSAASSACCGRTSRRWCDRAGSRASPTPSSPTFSENPQKRRPLRDARGEDRAPDGLLDDGLVQVVAPPLARSRDGGSGASRRRPTARPTPGPPPGASAPGLRAARPIRLIMCPTIASLSSGLTRAEVLARSIVAGLDDVLAATVAFVEHDLTHDGLLSLWRV